MIRIRNAGVKEFIDYIQNRKLYIFGAGKITENCVNIYCQNIIVEAVLDNNKKLWGSWKKFKNQEIQIISVDSFIKRIEGQDLDDIVMLIAPHIYASSMIRQLDSAIFSISNFSSSFMIVSASS